MIFRRMAFWANTFTSLQVAVFALIGRPDLLSDWGLWSGAALLALNVAAFVEWSYGPYIEPQLRKERRS